MATPIRPAATLILARPGVTEPEVLMLQRSQSAVFLGGAYVFPGGSLETQDSDPRLARRVLGLDDAAASKRLDLPSGGIAYWIAAVRECFEEAGVLLASDRHGNIISAGEAGALLQRRDDSFLELLESEELYIPGEALAYFGHWITAPGRPRRFDTRFFLALDLDLFLHAGSMLGGRAPFDLGHLQPAGQLLFFRQRDLVAAGELFELLLQCGGLFGPFSSFRFHRRQFFL